MLCIMAIILHFSEISLDNDFLYSRDKTFHLITLTCVTSFPLLFLHLAGVVLTEISEVHRNVHLELEENVSLEYVFANVYMFCFTLTL